MSAPQDLTATHASPAPEGAGSALSARPPAVAIVGMACRFPGADDLEAFWRLLLDGGDAVIDIPEGRWNLDALRRFNEGQPLPTPALRGGWLRDVKHFDAALFRISPREARAMDPKQRMSLEVIHAALEDAALAPDQHEGDIGCFVGTAQSEYLMRFYNRMEVGGPSADRYAGPGNDASFTSGRIAAAFGFEGPNLNVNTACSTSLVAVALAMREIQRGACTAAVAGGVAIIQSPEHSLVMNHFGVLSPDARCKAFDASANGYVRAEGCGFVVLKRLDAAVRDGDRVYAVLEGAATNHNGASDNLMAPETEAQVRLLRAALADAGVHADAVGAVEAHGTGTALGDPIEIAALAEVFVTPTRDVPLQVASVKTNIGHLEVAAGVAGLIKAALSVHHGTVPAHLHLHTLNPRIDAALPFTYPRRTTPWPERAPRRAVVNSFGISGINAAVVLSAPQATSLPPAAARGPVATPSSGAPLLLPLGAATDAALRALAARWADALERGDAHALARTAALGRTHGPARLAVVARGAAEAIAALRAAADGADHPALRRGDARGATDGPLAFLFTGQGSQRIGMGLALAAALPAFDQALRQVGEALAPHLDGHDLRHVLAGEGIDLHDTRWAQPALFAVEWALATTLISWGVVPAALVGHSVGEIVAATLAGVFSLPDAARFVAARGRAMGALPRRVDGRDVGAMAAVFAAADDLVPRLAGTAVELAADNGPTSSVISGPAQEVDAIVARLQVEGITARALQVSHAFHSGLMEPALPALREALAGVALRPPALPILSNLTGSDDVHFDDPETWVRHVRAPVRFRAAVLGLEARGVRTFVEIGPEPALLGQVRRTLSAEAARASVFAPTLSGAALSGAASQGAASRDDSGAADEPLQLLDTLAALWLAGRRVAWRGVHGTGPRPDAPRYPYERRPHWVDDPGPPVGTHPIAPPTIAPPTAPEAASGPSHASRMSQVAAQADAGSWWGPATYRLDWQPCTPTPRAVEPGVWIVAEDMGGLTRGAVAALRAAGHEVVTLRAADHDPGPPDAFHELARRAGPRLRGWVHAWPLDAVAAPPQAALDAQRQVSLGLLRAWQAMIAAGQGEVWTVTRGAVATRPGAPAEVAAAAAWGVSRVAALEHRAVRNVRLDLDPDAADPGAALARLLLAPPADEDQLAARGPDLLAARLVAHAPSGARLAPRGAWLITGGLGGLGLALAEHLAAAGASALRLAGRSAPSPAAEATLARCRALGCDARAVRLDVADADAVRAVVTAFVREAGPLRGVVHAAGVLADGPIVSHQEDARFLSVFPSKLLGALHLDAATADQPLDAFVLFSTVSSTLGAPGQVNYAAANAALDALAARRRARGQPAVSINWGPWGEVGMAARLEALMASRGMGGLRTADGLHLFDAVAADAHAQVTVMDMRVATILERDPEFRDAPLMRAAFAPPSGRTVAPHANPLHTSPTPSLAAPLPGPGVAETGLTPAASSSAPATAAATSAAGAHSAEDVVLTLAAELLGLAPAEVDRRRPLAWQGFDSVMATDLHKRLEAASGRKIPLDAIVHGPRPADVAALLGDWRPAAPPPAGDRPTPARPAAHAQPPAPPASAPPLARESAAPGPRDALARAGASATTTEAWVTAVVEHLLGLSPGEADRARPLAWQGFDSVLALDLHRAISARYGRDVPLDALVHGPRISEIAALLGPLPELPVHLASAPPAEATAQPAASPSPPHPAAGGQPHRALSAPDAVPAPDELRGPPPLAWLAVGVLFGVLATFAFQALSPPPAADAASVRVGAPR